MDPSSAHLVDPLVEVRALLQGKVPPNILKRTSPWDLLPIGDELSNVIGADVVPMVVGNGVHSRKHVDRWRRER